MKINITLFLICLVTQIAWSQNTNQKTLQGQVVTDSIIVDFGYVINLNSHVKANIESKGFFKIPAQVKDTLLFLGLEFKAKKVILTADDFKVPVLKIRLKADITKLEEVTIDASGGLKPNIPDSQTIVDQQYYDDEKSTSKNPIVQPGDAFENQADFVRMFKDLKKLLKKKKEEDSEYISKYTFVETVSNTYNQNFFTETLDIDEKDIVLFIVYCDNDNASKKFLKPHTKFELTNYLVSKKDEFKKLTDFDK